MLTCPKCGVDNQLGRVFCSSCGAKLDLANMTSQSVAESQKKSWIARFWWIVPVAIVLVAALMVACAFWPKTDPLDGPGTRVQGRTVETTLISMGRVRQGRGGGKALSAAEINAFSFPFPRRDEAAGEDGPLPTTYHCFPDAMAGF